MNYDVSSDSFNLILPGEERFYENIDQKNCTKGKKELYKGGLARQK